jgi:hypothetical protein
MGEVKELKRRGAKSRQAKAPEAEPAQAPAVISLQFDDGRGSVGETGDFRSLLEEQKARFEAKFKRHLRPSDPLFFDPDLDLPALIPREKLPLEAKAAFEQATAHTAMVYAQFRVGFFLSPMNYDVATDEQQRAWEDAVREFAYLKGLR